MFHPYHFISFSDRHSEPLLRPDAKDAAAGSAAGDLINPLASGTSSIHCKPVITGFKPVLITITCLLRDTSVIMSVLAKCILSLL